MMLKLPNLTYRTRKRMKTAAVILGGTLALILTVWLCWILWLGRFVVYSREGVRLDFDWVTPGTFTVAEPPEQMPINIRFNDGSEPLEEQSRELAQLNGRYITLEMLSGDLSEVDKFIREQEVHEALTANGLTILATKAKEDWRSLVAGRAEA